MRKTALAAGGVALVLALSACGGGSEAGTAAPTPQVNAGKSSLFSDPLQLVAAAKAGTEKSKSSKFSMETSTASQSIKATGQASYDGANTAMSMSMDMAGEHMEMVFIGNILYVKVPAAQLAQMGGGKPWIKISTDGSDPMSQALAGVLNNAAQQNDPTKTLEQISKAGKITKSEQTQLDGQPVTHYTIDLDFAKLLDQFAASMPGGLPADVKDKVKGESPHFPAELWLNSDQLPVQIAMDMTNVMSAVGAPAEASTKTTIRYLDWGAPVDIKAPPADQVGEFPKMGG
jgi:hypothetical protein